MKTNFELFALNINFNNIKENECYAINELITAHTPISCIKE